jgi:hypothetical protein
MAIIPRLPYPNSYKKEELLGRVKTLEDEVENLKKQIAELLLIYGAPDGLRHERSTGTSCESDSE